MSGQHMMRTFFARVARFLRGIRAVLYDRYIRHRPIRVQGMILHHHGVHESKNILRIASKEYEQSMTERFISLLEPGHNVVDVGAYIGYYTLLAARGVGPSGHVWAFEPFPETCALLEQNLVANSLCDRVSIAQVAVSRDTQRAKFYLHWNPTRASLVYRSGLKGARVISVPTIALDQFFAERNNPRIDVVKIDVEGAELDVLEGMKGLVDRNPRLRLFVEYNPVTMAAAGIGAYEFIRELYQVGFGRVYVLERNMTAIEPTAAAAAELDQWARLSKENTNLLCTQTAHNESLCISPEDTLESHA